MITASSKGITRVASVALWLSMAGCASTRPAQQPSPAPTPSPAPEQPAPQPAAVPEEETPASLIDERLNLDTVAAGPFDAGKMWTFEYPPLDYFRETYGFEPDSVWFRHARLGSLRLPNCSASFVSPKGLVLTNHHCARESVLQVSAPGEQLLDSGFYARNLADERLVEGLTLDQLIAIEDVSDEVQTALQGVEADSERAQVLQNVSGEISSRLSEKYRDEAERSEVEVIALWDGARYSAYVFRVYDDVRLVMAPELELGQFGGDPDNFTYPRYSLDFSFLRVYDATGEPLRSENYFQWDEAGVDSGEAVFIVGNPGQTSRLQTLSQLRFLRKAQDRDLFNWFTSRAEVMERFMEEAPQVAEERGVRNTIDYLLNFKKSYEGTWESLFDPIYMARKRDAERQLRDAIASDSALAAQFGGLFERMAEIQEEKLKLAPEYGAFLNLANPDLTSSVLFRAIFGYQYVRAKSAGVPPAVLDQIKEAILEVSQQPLPLQRGLLTARLQDFQSYFGEGSRTVSEILQGRTPAQAAADIISGSALTDSASAARVLAADSLTLQDPALQLAGSFLGRYFAFGQAWSELEEREAAVAAALGRARFHVYGTKLPPDATFSLRIADGVVKGYEYNGTYAPVYTTFYGLYDHYYSYGAGSAWDLPQDWLKPPPDFDLSTPLNFVSTADIIGGNSGSPVLDKDLRLVGVVFDGNIDSLPGEFIYDPEVNRAIAVDARGILEALRVMYGADRLVQELLGNL